MTKFIFVTGGVLSSLGKGITSASIAAILKQSGFKVSMLKIDPYLNVDPGTMSPLEHGEVFVTADGAETDLDLGNYERFIDRTLTKINSFTTGQVYQSVIKREREGGYLGKTIQVIPHVVDEIKSRIFAAAEGNEFLIIEIGGTVGDIESLPFLEAIRSIRHELPKTNTMNIHVSLVPYIKAAGELKTKPTQHSVQELRRIGITPHMLVCRTEKELPKALKDKLALSCDIDRNAVIEAGDAQSIYQMPLHFIKDGILNPLQEHFNIKIKPNMEKWDTLVKNILVPQDEVNIALVGKYLDLKESYKSLVESLIHAGAHLNTKINIHWCDSERIEDLGVYEVIGNVDAILVAGGFGARGVEGKLKAIQYARENNIVFLGICLGMQLSIVEFGRNVLGLEDANSVEFDENTTNPMIYLIDEFIDQSGHKQLRTSKSPMGGTMRLGEYPFTPLKGSKLQKAYGDKDQYFERHRHRYEANPKYKEALEKAGMIVSGESNGLIEVVELRDHPWFVGVQFHPEFTSHLETPNPIILEFVKQANKPK
ncbi:CTP synthase [Aliarcobacter skirrowii]|uniref:CTP synthase n=1 Tax=Aliarcobacter skirrowii CCUG 10374 TaxID=1032239 RepID=A0AAD0SJW4_9BACT|nr:CTP synthase [Aliarcobacter skirrowii]AXX83975.1 CTP synthetase [Aliarcobacter skirrowii CCUG 10374]KAB0621834.1 CTP synthase [Aliarcobacter skirrowii CCUG 10374]MDX4036687.1 CTP synthase [Aliarcobacter skirrowii]RXI27086.1 CTP synthetase [Aliarcobacter skirrowii CCUG 10374]SUU95531.1 CTP synthase [Aliarcobacter skirrowii]